MMDAVNVIEGLVVTPYLQRKQAPPAAAIVAVTAGTAVPPAAAIVAVTATAVAPTGTGTTGTATAEADSIAVAAVTGTAAGGTETGLTDLLRELAIINIDQLRLTEKLKDSLKKVKNHLRGFSITETLKTYVTQNYDCRLYHALFQLLPSCEKFMDDVGLIGTHTFVTDVILNTVKNHFANVNQEDDYKQPPIRYYLKDDSSFKSYIYNMVILPEDNIEAKKTISKIRKVIANKISEQLTMVTKFLFSETDDDDYSSCGDVDFNDNDNDNDSSFSNNNDSNNDNNSNDSDNNDNDNDNNDDLEGDDDAIRRHGKRDADEEYINVTRNYSKKHVMEAFEKELNNGENDDNIFILLLW